MMIIVTLSCSKISVLNMFSVHAKNARLDFPNSTVLKSVFGEAPFSWRISVDGRPNRKKKAACSNFPPTLCGQARLSLTMYNWHSIRPHVHSKLCVGK